MGAVKRIVSTSFWEDDKVINEFTPEDKYFMLYLLTNPHTKQIGIYSLNVKQASFELGYSTESVKSLLERFENKYQIIKRSKTTSEIALKNYLCYSVVKGGKPVYDLLEKELKTIKDKSLIKYIFNELENREDLLDTVKKFIESHININDIYNDNDKENDNDNDNDNDSTMRVRATYDRAYVERTQEKKEKEENNARTRVSFNSNNLNIKDKLNHAISFNDDLNELIQLKYECMKINNDDIDDELANLYNELLTKIANIKVQNSKNNTVVEQPLKDAYSCIKEDDELPF